MNYQAEELRDKNIVDDVSESLIHDTRIFDSGVYDTRLKESGVYDTRTEGTGVEEQEIEEKEIGFPKETYRGVIKYYTTDNYEIVFDIKNQKKTIEDFKTDINEFIDEYYPEETQKELVIQTVIENLFGYGILTPLIDDEDITDIKILAYNQIRYKKQGKRYTSDIKFSSKQAYKRFIENVATKNKANISNMNALQRFVDNKSLDKYILRFTLNTPFITSDEDYKIIIRKEPRDFYSMDDLSNATVLHTEEPMMPPEIKDLIIERWKNGSVLICGAMSSGKTYLLNALKEETPEYEAQIVIQQADELSNKTHPDTIFLHSVEGNGESDTKYDLGRLSVGALTCDVDRVIIGEVKGDEAMYLLNASYTGSICGATVHSNCAKEGIDKMVDYALISAKYTKRELMKMMTSFKTVIYLKKFKVQEIVAVQGFDDSKEEIIYETLYSRI